MQMWSTENEFQEDKEGDVLDTTCLCAMCGVRRWISEKHEGARILYVLLVALISMMKWSLPDRDWPETFGLATKIAHVLFPRPILSPLLSHWMRLLWSWLAAYDSTSWASFWVCQRWTVTWCEPCQASGKWWWHTCCRDHPENKEQRGHKKTWPLKWWWENFLPIRLK